MKAVTQTESLFAELQTPVEDMGTITIRVVVLPKPKPKVTGAKDEQEDDSPTFDDDGDDSLESQGSTAVGSYLEKPRGRLCCVFLVNGQRQEALDNSFIVQNLEFKYLRSRMMIIVDVDGLSPEVLGQLMQGNRQSFYRGKAWDAVFNRLVATLKNDPDIKQLEVDAEQELASLKGGDEKVREALDALIESHHSTGGLIIGGEGPASGLTTGGTAGLGSAQHGKVVELLDPSKGDKADYPVLTLDPPINRIRLSPGEERTFVVCASPTPKWQDLASITLKAEPSTPDVTVEETITDAGARYVIRAIQPEEIEPEDYPIKLTIEIYAVFNGHPEPRHIRLPVTVVNPGPTPPPPPVTLLDSPTFIKVKSRQPVKLRTDGAFAHVRLVWDGRDELAGGPNPDWTFTAVGVTPLGVSASGTPSLPRDGRFSIVVPTPTGAIAGDEFQYVVTAHGPGGRTLTATFTARVTDVPVPVSEEPRLVDGALPAGGGHKRPYDDAVVTKDQWDSGTCWDSTNWGPDDPGAFQDPTPTKNLTLILNEDYAALTQYKEYLVARKLAESDIERRLRRYKAHMYYYLYLMYQSIDARARQAAKDDAKPVVLSAEERRGEIQRVATTMMKLMEVR